jgi:chitodextrinase
MKFIPKILALLLVFGISTFSVFAINSPINVLSSNVTETNSLLSWDAAENALGYNVYFSTVSPIELLTAEKKEYINGLEVMLDDLSANTQYYYIVSAFDSEGIQSDFSDEYTFSTT